MKVLYSYGYETIDIDKRIYERHNTNGNITWYEVQLNPLAFQSKLILPSEDSEKMEKYFQLKKKVHV